VLCLCVCTLCVCVFEIKGLPSEWYKERRYQMSSDIYSCSCQKSSRCFRESAAHGISNTCMMSMLLNCIPYITFSVLYLNCTVTVARL